MIRDRRFPLSRRALLRGSGAALALPWLEAMTAKQARAGVSAPVRMAAMYMPNGVHPGEWTPAGENRDFQLSPTLSPLADLKDDLLVLTNLWNQGSKGGEGHYVKISGFLTCTTVTKTLGVDISCNGISMDQLAAQRAGDRTPLPSLELAVSPVTTGVDKNVGYTRVYGSHIAWKGPNTPLAREIDPKSVFERLLRATRPATSQAKQERLLLDLVLDDARQLRKSLGGADQRRLDEYLAGVRSIEQRVERASVPGKSTWTPRAAIDETARPEAEPKDYAGRVRLMLDMMALAFQSDTTRISTFMFGNEVSNQNFSFVEGVKGSHHEMSHHENKPEKMRQYQLIARWHVEQYGYLLRKLASIREGERSLLEQSMILFGSGLRDGNRHDPHNLPLLVGGRAGGRLASGKHLVYGADTPLSNLYVSMLDAFGTPVDRFADSTGRLPGVLA